MIETMAAPLIVHAVTAAPARADALDGYDVRRVALVGAAYLLGTKVADFDAVHVAAALEDVKCCPLCRRQPGIRRRESERCHIP